MSHYVGRFAPTPTGPLHFGSLVAAVASYLDALAASKDDSRAAGGQWIVRIEDLDRDRTQPGVAAQMLRDLEAFGFEWDGPVLYQSARTGVYAHAFERLVQMGVVYPCACSRKEIADSAVGGGEAAGLRYPGTCREGIANGRTATSWRVRVPDGPIVFTDRVVGGYSQNLASSVGDFVVKRVEVPSRKPPHWHAGLVAPLESFTYQFAVVVDDSAQGVTHVVRGVDLLDSTPRQIYLQTLLGYPTPSYAHIPVVLDAHGQKLSKQTGATALDVADPARQLREAMLFLARFFREAPPDLELTELWRWARSNWAMATAKPRVGL